MKPDSSIIYLKKNLPFSVVRDTLTDEKLASKPSKKGAVGRPKAKKAKQSKEDPAEGSKKKESKK